MLPADSIWRRTLSITQACELAHVSRRTIYNWMGAGKVEYCRTAGGSVRIFEDTVFRDGACTRAGPAAQAVSQSR